MKRLFDVVVASALLVLAAPFMLVIGVLVRTTTDGPALHRQTRVGWKGRPFTMYKFRTMTVGGDDSAQREFNRRELAGELDHLESFTLPEDTRVTSVGAPLRRSSLDELPQLVNVLTGDMSIVGPRPSLDWEVELFDAKYQRRADVRPGMTGLWQVNGRRTVDMNGMLQLDLDYVDQRSLWMDIQILFKTLPAVLMGDGAA